MHPVCKTDHIIRYMKMDFFFAFYDVVKALKYEVLFTYLNKYYWI